MRPAKTVRALAGDQSAATAEGLGGASTSDITANPLQLQCPRRVPRRFVTKCAGVLSHAPDGRLLLFTRRAAAEHWARAHYNGLWDMRNPFTDELAGGFELQRGRVR